MLPRLYLSRPRLLESLSQAAHSKVTIVGADAGYGKTSLVTEWISATGLRAEWHRFAATDSDLVRLADSLHGCLQRLSNVAAPASTARKRLPRAKTPDLPALTELLLRQAERIAPEQVFLVLDDYQVVDQEADVNLLLGSLIEGSTPNLHFLVLSRGAPRLSLAKLRAQQEVSILGEDDLSFTLDETGQFLNGERGGLLDPAAMALVQERTEGWAAGIAMISQSLRHGVQDKLMSALADPVASAWLVYDYLAEEVFDRQPAAVREFLLRTSILDTMNGAVCDDLLGTTASRRMLLSLEEGGLFTTSVDPSRQTFRYHQLFRELLRQKLLDVETTDAVKALHLRASRYYESHGQWEECVHHALQAGDAGRAATVVESVGERHLLSGFRQTVDRWLKALPDDLTMTRPRLLELRAHLSFMSANNETAIRLFEQALRAFEQGEDVQGEARALGGIAYVTSRSHQVERSIPIFEQALSKAKGMSATTASILVELPAAYRHAGMLDAAMRAGQAAFAEAESIVDEVRRLQIQSRATRHIAAVLMERGEIDAAWQAVQRVMDLNAAGTLGEHEQSWALTYQGILLWIRGGFEESLDALNRALPPSGRRSGHFQQRIGPRIGNALRDSGRFGEAEKAYEVGGWEAPLESTFMDVLLCRGASALSRAEGLYQQSRLTESFLEKSAAEVILATALHECGESAKALGHIKHAVGLMEGAGFRLRTVSALWHEAGMEYELRLPEARATLARALQLASDCGWCHFFWWDPQLMTFLYQRALEEDVLPDLALQLGRRRLAVGRADAVARVPLGTAATRHQPGMVSILDPHHAHRESLAKLLLGCGDEQIKGYLQEAVARDLVSVGGLFRLRDDFLLTWREIEVFIDYYLREALPSSPTSTPLRVSCANRLGISPSTVRYHVRNIRSKLDLPDSLSGRAIQAWAQAQGWLLPKHPRRHSSDAAASGTAGQIFPSAV